MPTLVRLLTTLVLIAAAVFGIMAALVYFVEPRQRPVVIELPLEKLRPPPQQGAPIAPPRS